VEPAAAVPLPHAAGRVLAEPVRAPSPLPRFDNAAMDGYAVRASDVAGADPDTPLALRLVAPSSAGQATPPELPVGCACPIATGAPMPAGADAVIMLEHAVEHGDRVLVSRPVGRGRNVRRRGEDVAAGMELLHPGQVVTAGQIVAAAALGRTTLQVRRPPRVTIVLTGTEVVPAGQPPAEHQVVDAVGPALQALLGDVGCTVATLGPIDDDPDVLAATLLEAATASDAVITVGGASVGRHDHLKQVLRRHGDLHAWRVALRPAKPFVFGVVAGTAVFGLPGNPVSALVAYEVFVRPALLAMQGRSGDRPRRRRSSRSRSANLRAVCTWSGHSAGWRPAGVWSGPWAPREPAWCTPWPPRTPGWSFPPEVEHLPAGALVEVWPLWGQEPAGTGAGRCGCGRRGWCAAPGGGPAARRWPGTRPPP
jgi:molybdopterin molybdotransferase